MEFTRPENNVLNLHDARYDFLVTTTVEIESLIWRRYILLLAFTTLSFPKNIK